MSGSGHHDGGPLEGKKAGQHIKDELLSALKLLFKSAEHHAVNLTIEPELTHYLLGIGCETEDAPLSLPDWAVSEDPIRAFQQQAIKTATLPLLSEAQLAESSPCHIEPGLCHEPVFEEMNFNSAGISFENLELGNIQRWPVEKPQARSIKHPFEKVGSPKTQGITKEMLSVSLEIKSRSALEQFGKVKLLEDSRLYALPIRKTPIPPHRFPLAAREKFRQALADKAKTNPANVQLKVIFERMHMALYTSIQPDEAGNLLCIPKSELLGKNMENRASQAMLSAAAAQEAMYLVVGVQLDNKADIRSLVPVDSIMIPTEGEAKP